MPRDNVDRAAASFHDANARVIEDERRRIVWLIGELPHDDWRDFLAALEVASGHARQTPENMKAAEDTLHRHLYEEDY